MGRLETKTAASTAGMLVANSPWKFQRKSGSVRRSGDWVRISGNRNPFHCMSAW